MITLKGKIKEGKILALEPVDEAFEGEEVTILLDTPQDSEVDSGLERLWETIKKNQINTGITDLAHQHDHYLYGTPKRED